MGVGTGRRVKELRELLRLNQRDFAAALKITQASVSRWERLKTEVPYNSLVSISTTFNASLNWLLSGYGPIFNEDKQENKSSVQKTPLVIIPPYFFALTQGLGRETARAFETLCNMTEKEKVAFENFLTSGGAALFARILEKSSRNSSIVSEYDERTLAAFKEKGLIKEIEISPDNETN